MDDSRDIQKKDNVSRILSGSLKARPFGGNIAGERAYTRAERCAVAIHLVTNHVPHTEPARVAARRGAIDLLTHVLDLRNEMRSGGRAVQETVASIRKQISLMRILSSGGFVSAQNIEVLVEALDELANILERSQRSALAENIMLKSDDFIGATSAPLSDIKKTSTGQTFRPNMVAGSDLDVKRTSHRSDSIMATLKVKGIIGIKDISLSLPEYSEKMIQRELLRLVGEGKVIKSGSKRWSTYSLAG